jgi:inhibitor of KinA
MRIFPLGDSAATIELGNQISIELNDRSIALAKHLESNPFDGMIEAVPAYASLTIFYDPSVIAFAAVKTILSTSIEKSFAIADTYSNIVEIPVRVSDEASPDLDRIADFAALTVSESLDIFFKRSYRVYMLGFLPGFAYMGEVDDRVAAPRLETPRTKVPKGSVGIAGKQTGIYPLESPGGWNLIGVTDLPMFDPTSDDPCILKPGDEVRFVQC